MIPIKNQNDITQVTNAINNLFITYRKSYIIQNKDGTYINSIKSSKNTLTDTVVKSHLKLKETIGIFCNPFSSKFICFDLDMGESSESERVHTAKLVISKIQSMGIRRDYIYVANSGLKGWHIYIFFDDIINKSYVEGFYSNILILTNLIPEVLELRPKHTMGIKLPLGLHKKSNNRTFFVDESFNKITDQLFILNIKQFPAIEIKRIVEDSPIKKEDLDKLSENIKYNQMCPNKTGRLSNSQLMKLEIEGMTSSGTRNYCCTQLSMFYRNQGFLKEEALVKLNEWIKRQSVEFYKSTIKFCLHENEDIIEWAYSKPIYYDTKNKTKTNVKIYKSEIDRILNIKNLSSRKILLAMLIHCKIYGGKDCNFAMTYKMIKYHANINSDATVAKVLRHLIETGEIKVTRKGNYESMIANMFSIKLSMNKIMYSINIEQDIEYYKLYSYELSQLLLNP